MESNDIKRLLEEIRDLEQEHLAEYKRVAQRSLEMHEAAANRAEAVSQLYKRALLVGSVIGTALVLLVFYLVIRYL